MGNPVYRRNGRNFMDLLEGDVLTSQIRRFLPNAPMRQKVAFNMRKGNVLPFSRKQNVLQCGLGWDSDARGGPIDLDTSCVGMTAEGSLACVAFFGNLVAPGMKHSGDNLTGEGEGDDEVITIELDKIMDHVAHVFFVINIYSNNRTFQDVQRPYCRVVDPNLRMEHGEEGAEICKYELKNAGTQTALIVSRLQRDVFNRWGFHALGMPAHGKTYKDVLPELQKLCHIDTRSLYRSQSSFVPGMPPPGAMQPPGVYPSQQPYGYPPQDVYPPQGGYPSAPPPPMHRAASYQLPDAESSGTCCTIQ
eukprot:GHVN01079623.1.p1 GENE.GHVN01079623.1~~GHVN01079623.1.p1  ORF type:complete len:305 (-),score=26.48 GHVN01079623.1:764-1678(-)